MPLTVNALREVIDHTLGGAPASGASYARIINGAGRSFAASQEWYWLSDRTATLTGVAGSEWVELPDDYAAIQEVYVSGAYYELVRMTTAREFMDWQQRSGGITTPYPYVGTVMNREDDDAGYKPWLRIYPAPATADTYTVLYDAQWVDVNDDQDEVPIPGFMEHLLEEWVRAYARGLDEEDAGALGMRLEALKASSLYMDACRRDAATTGTALPPPVGPAAKGPAGYLRYDLGAS